ALDARLEVVSSKGTRTIAAADFFDGLWSTSMEPEELLVGVSFPVWGERSGFSVEELARRHGDFAIAGAAVGIDLDREGRSDRCAIGMIGLGSTAERAQAAEAELVGRPFGEVAADEVGRLAVAGLEAVPTDLHGSADYRTRVGAVMVTRAWGAAGVEARR